MINIPSIQFIFILHTISINTNLTANVLLVGIDDFEP